jgi:hypothetical protein
MSRDSIRQRVHRGDTKLLADIRKAASDPAVAGQYDEAAAFHDLEAEVTEEAPKVGIDIGQAVEVDVGDGALILGTITAIYPEARNVDVEHFESVTTGNGYKFPAGYVSTHPIDAVTVILPPEPVAEPALPPSPSLPPVSLSNVFAHLPTEKVMKGSVLVDLLEDSVLLPWGGSAQFPGLTNRPAPVTDDDALLPKTAASGVLVKSALASQERHGGPVEFPERTAPITRNSASDARRAQEEKDARAHA